MSYVVCNSSAIDSFPNIGGTERKSTPWGSYDSINELFFLLARQSSLAIALFKHLYIRIP
jgi:hypothetical protein